MKKSLYVIFSVVFSILLLVLSSNIVSAEYDESKRLTATNVITTDNAKIWTSTKLRRKYTVGNKFNTTTVGISVRQEDGSWKTYSGKAAEYYDGHQRIYNNYKFTLPADHVITIKHGDAEVNYVVKLNFKQCRPKFSTKRG